MKIPNFRVSAKNIVHTALLSASLIIIGCGDQTADNAKQAEIHQKTAASYIQQGQYRAAIIEARNVIKYSPDSVQGHLLLASIYNKLGNSFGTINILEPLLTDNAKDISLPLATAYAAVGKYQSAINTLKNIDQQSTAAQLIQARIEAGLKNTDKAEKIYTDLLAKDAGNAAITIELIKLQLQSGEQQKAISTLNTLLQQRPNNPQALFLKAQAAYFSNDLNSAEDYLTQALQNLRETDLMEPLKGKVLSQLAQTLTELGRTSESLIYTKLLAEANPEAHKARQQFNEALGLYQSGEVEKAEELLIKIYQDYPSNNISGMLLGMINLQQGDIEEAGELLEDNIDAETSSSQVISSTALTQLRLNKPEKAVALLEKALLSRPEDASIQAVYGLALLNIDNTDTRAALALQKALAIDPSRHKLHTILASHFLALGKNQQAYAQYNTALGKAPADRTVRDSYLRALLQNGEQEKALQLVNSFIQQSPEDPSVYLQATGVHLANKDQAAAEKSLNKTLSLAPNNVPALLGLGRLQLINQQWSKSTESFRKAVAENPSAAGYKGLITAQQAQKQGDKIISELTAEATTTPDNAILHTVLAEYFARENQADMALKYADSAIATKPVSNYASNTAITIYRSLSKRLLASGDIDRARKRLAAALELAPSNNALLGDLIDLELQSKNYSEATNIADQIELAEQGELAGKYFKGKIFVAQQQWPEAISNLKAAWEISPTDRVGSLYYRTLKKAGDQEQASKLLDSWINALPQSSTPLTFKAVELHQKDSHKAAADYYNQAISLNPSDAMALNNLAWLYFETDNPAALETARKATTLAPGNPAILDTYGWIEVNKGDKAKGLAALKKAAELAPGNQEISDHYQSAKSL